MEQQFCLKNVADMIIETYDPKILDNPMITTKELKQAFYKLAETENALGGPRKVLAELISNHKNGVKKPIPEFIAGPFTLTCHFSNEYKKMIYIFGEYHTYETDCGNLSTNKMLVEDFIYELIDKTDVFIDIFLEINAMKRKAKEYNSYDGISNSRSISELFTNLQKCIQYNTRHDNECRLSRVNYFDIRKINDNSYNIFYEYISDVYHKHARHLNDINKLVKSYNKGEISEELYDQLKQTKIKETFDEIKHIIDLNNKRSNFFYHLKNDNVENFWLDRMYNNEYVIHELKKITDEELHEKITDFFEQSIRTFVYSNKENWNDNIDIVIDAKTNMNDYLNSVKFIFDPCMRLLSHIADMYTICRMFKDFDLEKKPYEGADYKDQPKRANNIIIYAGDAHSIFYRAFLDKMQFEKISAKSQSQTCIDVRNFPLPFFSMSAIDKYYIERKEKAILKQLENDQKQIIELYEADTITKKDVIKSLNSLLGEYRYYLHIEKLTINTSRNKLARQFRDLRKKLAELEGKQFISSFEF
jgi:hypothetical protein